VRAPARAEHRQRERRPLRLHQPQAEDAQHVPVLEIHLGQVGQHAHAELGLTALEQYVGGVEEERCAVGVRRPLVEIDAIRFGVAVSRRRAM
jgi:hypothetical protein